MQYMDGFACVLQEHEFCVSPVTTPNPEDVKRFTPPTPQVPPSPALSAEKEDKLWMELAEVLVPKVVKDAVGKTMDNPSIETYWRGEKTDREGEGNNAGAEVEETDEMVEGYVHVGWELMKGISAEMWNETRRRFGW